MCVCVCVCVCMCVCVCVCGFRARDVYKLCMLLFTEAVLSFFLFSVVNLKPVVGRTGYCMVGYCGTCTVETCQIFILDKQQYDNVNLAGAFLHTF